MTTAPQPAPLVARTIPLADPGPLLATLPREGALAWVRRGEGLVGWGAVTRIETGGPDRITDAEAAWQHVVAQAVVRDEVGLPGFFASLWYGLWVPKNTPKKIIAKLNATMVQVLADPAVKARLTELGIEITPLAQQSPEALRAYQKAEAERWWPIIKAANLKGE